MELEIAMRVTVRDFFENVRIGGFMLMGCLRERQGVALECAGCNGKALLRAGHWQVC